MHPRLRAAAAGAAAAVVWGVVEPVDQRLLRHGYSDIAVLGKAFTRGPGWRPLGFALHAFNGAVVGLAYHEVARRTDRRRLAVELALAEHLVLFSTGKLVDRYHPARGEPGVERLFSGRAFVQATLRHALFGAVLGRLAR
jgi:hypothetical protein